MSAPDPHALLRLAISLIDQREARVLVPPLHPSSGFWFGGGNIARADDGSLLIVGRYRSAGDSRLGVSAGQRGLELAIFRAESVHGPWEKILTWSKEELNCGGKAVVSIEGASLLVHPDRVELFVSTEKDVPYPPEVADYQKPGTGVWSIDVISAPALEKLKSAPVTELFTGRDLAHLHVKDPTAFHLPDGRTGMIYCNHPYTWSSSNSSLAIRPAGGSAFEHVTDEWLPRGPVWDISVTRITDRMPIPRVGVFKDTEPASLYFYCGAEALRQLDENPHAVRRPRGWSCEEIGGVAWGLDREFPKIQRLSVDGPLFTSPNGTGCSRYVSTLVLEDGILAAWQQSQKDLSQPLVGHFLPMDVVASL